MNKKAIIKRTEKILQEILIGKDIFFVEIEYTKESNLNYLRIYINKKDGISINECADVSRELSSKLDEADFIDENYFLEVSSPGIDRAFKSIDDYLDNVNNKIEVNLYSKQFNRKSFIGKLIKANNDTITIQEENENNNMLTFNLKDIAKANKYIDF